MSSRDEVLEREVESWSLQSYDREKPMPGAAPERGPLRFCHLGNPEAGRAETEQEGPRAPGSQFSPRCTPGAPDEAGLVTTSVLCSPAPPHPVPISLA